MSGPAASTAANKKATSLKVELTEDEDAMLFQSMYQLEKVPAASKLTAEEKSTVKQFHDSVHQKEDGRYVCKLPRVANLPQLRESRNMAKARFLQNERKMLKLQGLDSFSKELSSYISTTG